jgi:hypothetical protein
LTNGAHSKDRKATRARRAAKRRARRAARAERAQRDLVQLARRSDDERRDRMRELDERTPLKPAVSDLIVGAAAERELDRIRSRPVAPERDDAA